MNKFQTPLFTRSYHIPLAYMDQAFRIFQKKYVYPRNILLTAVLLAVAGVYVQAAVKDNTQTLAYLLIVACIAIILVCWYRMFKLRRAVHEALAEIESDTYELNVYEEGITIRTLDMPEPEAAQPEDVSEEAVPQVNAESGGFQQIFPEEPIVQEPIPPTEISFSDHVKIHEFADYFMVYIVKQNFYVIPKKDFSEDEIIQLRKLFHISL